MGKLTASDVESYIKRTFSKIASETREAGQREYAHDRNRPFRNFEVVAEELGVSRNHVLMVYARKHWDGILAYVKGHKSQREHVSGRIDDLILYLCLLRAMIDEDVQETNGNTTKEIEIE